MDEDSSDGGGVGSKGGVSADDGFKNKRLLPPPLLHFQQKQHQQSLQHLQLQQSHQQQHKIYQQFHLRQQQQQQKFSADVIAAANAAAAVVANSAALPLKLHPLLQQSSLSSSSSSTSSLSSLSSANNGMISAPYVDVADRSDSGLGSSRTLNSGDERSGSHSSAFSGSDELHATTSSPLNDQHLTPPSAFNTVPIWRDPNMIQSMDGPIRHVDSVQHQSLFMTNSAQVGLPYQSFHPPPVLPQSASSIQSINADGSLLWKSPTASTNNNSLPTSNYYHHPNDQLRLNKVNAGKEKKSKPTSYALGLTVTSNGAAVENIPNEYGKIEIERLINSHNRNNREHNEKQQAEAAVHQHFEESLKLAQQPKRTNWISNLPIPQGGSKTQDTSKQRPSTFQTTNKRVIDEWKEKNNKTYSSHILTPIGPSFTRPLTHQVNYRPQTVPKLNYDHENVLLSVNENGNNNMISYAPYMNSNHTFSSSISSVIVRNDSSYKNPSISTQEVFANNSTPTILTVPAIKLDNYSESNQVKPSTVQYSRSVNTSQSKIQGTSQEPLYPEPLLNTHGHYTLYPPCQSSNQINTTSYQNTFVQRGLKTPPPAHLNAMMPNVVTKTTVPSAVPINDFQSEPLDLVVMCNAQTFHSDILESNVPLQLYSSNTDVNQDPQEITNKCDMNICNKPEHHLSYLETSLPDNTISPSLITVTNNATGNSSIVSTPLSMIPTTITATIQSPLITIVSKKLTNESLPVPSTTERINLQNSSAVTSKTPLSCILSDNPIKISTKFLTVTSSISISMATSTTTTSTVSITNLTKHNSSPSPPVLIPGPYTDMTCGIKTHHHKLKKAWLQRHEWAEDLREAGVNIDQNPSSSSQIDDIPPVLECEITKKRKISKSASENSVHLKTSSDLSPSESDIEPRTLYDLTKKSKKRKISTDTTPSENKSATESDRDSDLVIEKKVPPIKIPKKRGRKPKVVSIPLKKGKNNDGEERFFQSGPCLEFGPKIHKCRECRIFMNKKKKDVTTQDEIDNIFCRFYAFRRFFYNKCRQLINAGFPDPFRDVTVEDLNLWMPNSKFPPSSLDVDVAKKVLVEAGRQFCYLVKEENKALCLSPFFKDKPIAWKKAANGVREMCDVCLTTIFNYHWACAKCGFGVCIDCVKARLNGSAESPNAAAMTKKDLRERDTFMWMTCNNKQNHEVEKLMLTQIVAGDSMNIVFSNLHQISLQWNIELECGCPDHPFSESLQDKDSDDDNDESHSKPIDVISNTPQGSKNSLAQNVDTTNVELHNANNLTSQLENVQPSCSKSDSLKHFIRKKNKYLKTIPRELLPPREMTLAKSREFYPDNPHAWLCDGRLLRLLDPEDPTNCALFQEQWKRGQPVIVSDVGKRLNPDLWSPSSFCRDFGRYTNDLIDCATGLLVEGKSMKQFWDGFEDETKRLKDADGNKMLLKLKDWPVAADFSETLPERFDDLMRALPLKDYTQRNGKLNLASRLPSCFVRPDLGPKMYSAYGNAGHRDPGKQLLSTTNLHLDVSDAVNVMVFVAITQNSGHKEDEPDHDWHIKEAFRAVDEAGCDMASRRRARESKEFPGAVWHIYHASDADSIRDLLNKISAERGEQIEPNHDPIHDQSSYLDADLRARLYNEYGVQGYAVLQCLGDAIFIPAGAPHQVRNLHNCIKVAGDFVSPENVSQCFRLMNEFRDLSSNHTNHEDKLQIKNIMYHAVKDSLSVLLHSHQEEPH